jgi:drug/metabolite transporter (DMT)-like permease
MIMRLYQIVLLLIYPLGLALGQALFKLASANMTQAGRPSFLLLLSSVPFYLALILYGALTVLWVWLLSGVPLSRAYPFVALSFIFTPIFAVVAFNESVTPNYIVGLCLIIGGLILSQT